MALAVHPGSGQGSAARIAGTVAERLRAEVDELTLIAADTPQRFRGLVADCRAAGLDALVVLGGDGAMHQAVQCCAGTEMALGLVPAGTGNDFARALGIPERPGEAVETVLSALRSGRRRVVDVGRADGVASEGTRWFGTVLCTGFDAAVNARANRLPWPSGPRRYDVALLRELVSLRSRPVVVDTDVERGDLGGHVGGGGQHRVIRRWCADLSRRAAGRRPVRRHGGGAREPTATGMDTAPSPYRGPRAASCRTHSARLVGAHRTSRCRHSAVAGVRRR